MKPKRLGDARIDELLRQALADDLPADVAAGMRERIARVRGGPGPAPSAAWAWLRRRAVWAALSIVVLAVGIILQSAGASSPLADRISALKTASLSPGQIGR
jgi:hypothetical protein